MRGPGEQPQRASALEEVWIEGLGWVRLGGMAGYGGLLWSNASKIRGQSEASTCPISYDLELIVVKILLAVKDSVAAIHKYFQLKCPKLRRKNSAQRKMGSLI